MTFQQMALPYDRSPQSWGHTSPQISLARTALYKRGKASKPPQTLNGLYHEIIFFGGI
jgi:hypothetical protein